MGYVVTWAAVLSVTFPRLIGAFGIVGAFIFYAAGLNVCALVMVFFLVSGASSTTSNSPGNQLCYPNLYFFSLTAFLVVAGVVILVL